MTTPPSSDDACQQRKIGVLSLAGIFLETPRDTLAEIAPLLQEVRVPVNQVVFEKGDLGTTMYIIAEGSVRVHDGEMTLNLLGQGEVFGEMAALDPEPRSASVTAVEDTLLFSLDQGALRSVLAKSSGVRDGVIRVLCRRLRARVRDMKEDYQYMQQFNIVMTAAASVESGVYRPETLDPVTERPDELGMLARVFQRMVREVYAREQRLKAEIAALHIEIDEVKKARQVAEITGTDYFQSLQQRASILRQARQAGSTKRGDT